VSRTKNQRLGNVATGLQRLGVAMPVTEKVLNHVSGSHGGIAGVYRRHEYTSENCDALEAWDACWARSQHSANVVALARRNGA
jgi:hypothetical protein